MVDSILIVLILLLLAINIYLIKKNRSLSTGLTTKDAKIKSQVKFINQQAEEIQAVNLQVKEILDSLEQTINDRTQKIKEQNERLKQYAFSNAHEIRAPLARILGITALLKESEDLSEEQRVIMLESLINSSEEMDLIVRKVGRMLSANFSFQASTEKH